MGTYQSHLGKFRIFCLFDNLVFFSVNFGWSVCVCMLVLMCWHVGPGVLACWSWSVSLLILALFTLMKNTLLVMACWFVDPGFVNFDEEYLDLWVPCPPLRLTKNS